MNNKLIALLLCLAIVTPALATKGPPPPPPPKTAAELFGGAYNNKFPQPSDEQKAFQEIVSSNCPALDNENKEQKKVFDSLKAFAYCIQNLSSVSSHLDSQKEVLDLIKEIFNGPPPPKNSFASKVLKRKI